MLLVRTLACPYCGEPNEVAVDLSGGRLQSYEEDCQVCCRPWTVHVRVLGPRKANVRLAAQDEVDQAE